ncbi:hypothetical protein DdX_18550 [Ditylenchus destructor]|uniref:F-box domain-containing protein n=1 Tax=Ditylenchus destructor TaxID=166010 RepID=A0AAD4MJG9_9BILA|nr:hypothetical protein DdX_18550 [Ditylenchus destructor]
MLANHSDETQHGPCAKKTRSARQMLPLDVLYGILCFFSRNKLEYISIACRTINKMVVHSFPERPYRLNDRRHGIPVIELKDNGSLLQLITIIGSPVHPIRRLRLTENGDKWEGMQRGDRSNECFYSVERLRAYMPKSIRFSLVNLHICSNRLFAQDDLTVLESVAHTWDGRQMRVYFETDKNNCSEQDERFSQSIKLLFESPAFMRCSNLVLNHVPLPLHNFPILYSMKYVEIDVGYKLTPDPGFIAEFVEQKKCHPESNTMFEFGCGISKIAPDIFKKLRQNFEIATTPNTYWIALGFEPKKFRIENPVTKEVMQIRPEKESYDSYSVLERLTLEKCESGECFEEESSNEMSDEEEGDIEN